MKRSRTRGSGRRRERLVPCIPTREQRSPWWTRGLRRCDRRGREVSAPSQLLLQLLTTSPGQRWQSRDLLRP
eukprot:177725-Hanusia_phi.AAC.4